MGMLKYETLWVWISMNMNEAPIGIAGLIIKSADHAPTLQLVLNPCRPTICRSHDLQGVLPHTRHVQGQHA